MDLSNLKWHINSCVPLKDFKCCTAIRRTVSLSSFRFIALHMGSMEDNSVMYAFILSLLLFSISLWFCLRTERVILSVQSKENVCNMRLYYIFWPFFYPCKEIFSLTIRIIPPPQPIINWTTSKFFTFSVTDYWPSDWLTGWKHAIPKYDWSFDDINGMIITFSLKLIHVKFAGKF